MPEYSAVPAYTLKLALYRSFIISRQRCIEIDFNSTNQRLNALYEADIDRLESIGLSVDILNQELQESPHIVISVTSVHEHRCIILSVWLTNSNIQHCGLRMV